MMPTRTIDQIQAALDRPGVASSDFDLNPDAKPPGVDLRVAAVLVGLIDRDNETMVILTKRSSRLKHHPGQIAFPGGKVDADDLDTTATALREAHEEIGLPPGIVRPMGGLSPHDTITGFRVEPIVAEIGTGFDVVPELGEVEEVFEVPLAFVTDPKNFIVQYRVWQGQKRYYYTVPYGPYYIWGATARILRGLAERLA